MSTIRSKFLAFIFLSLTATFSLGYLDYIAFIEYKSIQNDLTKSFYLQEKILRLDTSRFSSEIHEELIGHRKSITPPHRAEALSDIIQSYANKNSSALKRSVQHFIKNEKEFRRYLYPLVSYLERRIEYLSALLIGLFATSLLIAYFYLKKSVFKEIQSLSQKMVDFLNQKYTYQFSVPTPNEVGDLQATFNSLAQRVLNQMDELKSLDRAKSDFLSIASHELRTPLTSIKGSLSLLKTGVISELPPNVKQLMTIAETETDRLIRLINDLLDLAKIDARRLPLKKDWVSLSEVLETTVHGLNGLANTAEVQLVISDHPKVDFFGDKDRIHQVLTNLLSNAIKYSPKGGSVTIHGSIDDADRLVICVEDQGSGISPEDQEIIFQKFRQANTDHVPLVKGTGLGLAIAKALVEEHNGVIGVHSKPNQGSVFYFTLGKWQLSNKNDTSKNESNFNHGVAA